MNDVLTLDYPATRGETPAGSIEDGDEDIIFSLQLAVARRADVLAGRRGYPAAFDRRIWLRAEQEIFERFERRAWSMAAR